MWQCVAQRYCKQYNRMQCVTFHVLATIFLHTCDVYALDRTFWCVSNTRIHDLKYMAATAAAAAAAAVTATPQRILVTSKTLSRPHYSFLRRFCTLFFVCVISFVSRSSYSLLFYTVIYFLHSFACSSRHIANVTKPLAIRNKYEIHD